MNALSSFFGPSVPPSAWSDSGLGAGRPASAPGAPAAGGVDWFGTFASARTLTVQRNAHAPGDVDGWTKALINHLLEPDDQAG